MVRVMDLSKLYQKELSYENSLGQTNINTFTGRVLFKMLDMNFNVDANNLNVLHVYNSNYTYLGFRGQPYGKKWKLNCEQFLYLEDNKYVYEDQRHYWFACEPFLRDGHPCLHYRH